MQGLWLLVFEGAGQDDDSARDSMGGGKKFV